jgi:hypothetical protein
MTTSAIKPGTTHGSRLAAGSAASTGVAEAGRLVGPSVLATVGSGVDVLVGEAGIGGDAVGELVGLGITTTRSVGVGLSGGGTGVVGRGAVAGGVGTLPWAAAPCQSPPAEAIRITNRSSTSAASRVFCLLQDRIP